MVAGHWIPDVETPDLIRGRDDKLRVRNDKGIFEFPSPLSVDPYVHHIDVLRRLRASFCRIDFSHSGFKASATAIAS